MSKELKQRVEELEETVAKLTARVEALEGDDADEDEDEDEGESDGSEPPEPLETGDE